MAEDFFVTAVHVIKTASGTPDITAYKIATSQGRVWTSDQSTEKVFDKAAGIALAENENNRLWVHHGGKYVRVYVRHSNEKYASGVPVSKWLQTAADGYYNDNLYALPRF